MRILIGSIILAVASSCVSSIEKVSDKQALMELAQLGKNQNFFKLKSVFNSKKDKLSDIHALYYSSIINNVFNKAEDSNKDIKRLLAKPSLLLTDSLMNKLYHTKLLNHINLYEYGEAVFCSEIILKNYQSIIDTTEINELKNEINIWRALKDVPKQTITIRHDATIPMFRDKAGLFNIDVDFGDTTKNLLFDTGANFSVIIKSMVAKLGLKLIDADFYVTAATGLKVKCDLAVADKLSIKGIIFNNVVFLVMNDEDLSFPQINYYPNGVIGFPVIEAMEEIRISKGKKIFVPKKPIEYKYNNFALDGLMPIIAGEYNGDTLLFHFDTGAQNTSLFPKFFKDYREQIEHNYKKEIFKSGSAGGSVQFEGYRINDFKLKVADTKARLDRVELHMEEIHSEENHFHGNFGQDYIKQFDEMIISFKYSSVLFK